MSHRRPLLALAVVAVLLGVAGCGTDADPEKESDEPTPRLEATTSAAPPQEFVQGRLRHCFIPVTEAEVEPARLRARGLRLPAAVFAPPGDADPEAVMVLLHQTDGGGLCGWGAFASAAALQGVASVAFDLCGYGSAECDVADPNDPAPQVRAALALVERRWPGTRVVLVGASMGGSQAVRAVASGVAVDGWVDLSGPSAWAGVELASLAERIDLPGLVAISEASDGPDDAAAAEALASATGAEFVPAESGHGYEMVADATLSVLPVGARVIEFTKGP